MVYNGQVLYGGDSLISVQTNFGGCDSTTVVYAESKSAFSGQILADTTALTQGEQVQLNVSVLPAGPISYSWTPVDGSLSCMDCPDPVASPLTDAEYVVRVMDPSGCSVWDSLHILVHLCGQVYANAFSPGQGDPVNRYFTIPYAPCIEQVNLLRIYDRWGELVFENQNFSARRTGTGLGWALSRQKFPAGRAGLVLQKYSGPMAQ